MHHFQKRGSTEGEEMLLIINTANSAVAVNAPVDDD